VWDRRSQTFIVIAALTEDKKILLVEEPKYGIMKRVLNLPAGGVDPGEIPKEAAERELLEETGFTANRIIPLRDRIIDFADRIAGGEHSFFLALGAVPVSEPEPLRKPILVGFDEAKALLMGTHPTLKMVTAMSLSCLAAAILRLNS
jgi:8-oxo-dGTP pyrophosphatase MutT (NUDIX family)